MLAIRSTRRSRWRSSISLPEGIASEFERRRYDDPTDVLVLLGYGVLENVGHRQWKTLVAWRGLYEYCCGDRTWGEMTRQRFVDADDAA